jgi:tripartite-type tricarboxylate transporter receptor subunit TctC
MRWLGFAVVGFFACAAEQPAQSEDYPLKPVRCIVPFAAGGETDSIARLITQKLSEAWPVQVITDNRPGAAGVIGLAAAAKSVPDGYTFVLGQESNVAVAPSLYAGLSYDPVTELEPVTQALSTPQVIVAHPSLPSRNIGDLIAFARARPGALSYGSLGTGTIGHLAVELLGAMTSIRLMHVPETTKPVLTSLLGGEIALYASAPPAVLPHIRSNRLRALAVTSARRWERLPVVPTVAESAVPGYEAVNWHGVLVPAGTSHELVMKLHAALMRVLAQPEIRERFATGGRDVVANTPAEFGAYIRSEIPKWASAVKAAGIERSVRSEE